MELWAHDWYTERGLHIRLALGWFGFLHMRGAWLLGPVQLNWAPRQINLHTDVWCMVCGKPGLHVHPMLGEQS